MRNRNFSDSVLSIKESIQETADCLEYPENFYLWVLISRPASHILLNQKNLPWMRFTHSSNIPHQPFTNCAASPITSSASYIYHCSRTATLQDIWKKLLHDLLYSDFSSSTLLSRILLRYFFLPWISGIWVIAHSKNLKKTSRSPTL